MNTMRFTGVEYFGTSTHFSQVLSHLQIEPPANGDPMCQASGEAIVEGDTVTPYLSRPAGHSNYTVDQYRCSDDCKHLISLLTPGVGELIVDGRRGQGRISGHNPDTLTASGDTQTALLHADRDSSAATSEPRSAGRVNDE